MEDTLVDDPYRISVRYRYEFDDGAPVEFAVDSELRAGEQEPCSAAPGEWTKLNEYRCDCCSLPPSESQPCPAIASVADVVEYFNEHRDYTEAKCTVSLPDKTIVARKSINEALSALMGLRMASSACPILSQLKPLARFHEPFASPYHTVFRAASMYLLGQYFRQGRGEAANWSLDGLRELYADIGEVNLRMSQRLKAARREGSSPVSMSVLSVFSITMSHLFDEHLDILRGLYES